MISENQPQLKGVDCQAEIPERHAEKVAPARQFQKFNRPKLQHISAYLAVLERGLCNDG